MRRGVGPPGAVVVTGAGSGIGAACARRLDRLGFQVFAGVRRPADGAALAGVASARLTPLLLDVTAPDSIAAAAALVAERVGPAGRVGLVNNAGIAVAGPLEFLPLAAVRRQLEVNTLGPLAVTQALLPQLRVGSGRVVAIGSISGRIAAPFTGPYHASKFALAALTDSLRQELRPWGIAVALIEPGVIDTPIWEKSAADIAALVADLPPAAHRLYGPMIGPLLARAARAGARGLPAEAVAAAVEHALTARRPKTRYLVGRDARLAALAVHLPDRLRDWLIARRLPRHPPAPDMAAVGEQAPARLSAAPPSDDRTRER